MLKFLRLPNSTLPIATFRAVACSLVLILAIVPAACTQSSAPQNDADPEDPAFAPVQEDPALPRVLLIGDSISIGYTVSVQERLKGKANVLRIPVNAGPTTRGMEMIDAWLGGQKWDVIHFNWGLHDVKRMKNGKMDNSGVAHVAPDTYAKNLDALTQRMKATGARLIWATTTPIPDGAKGRTKGDEVKANALAEPIMKKYGVAVDDLYSCVLPVLTQYQRPKDVHFKSEGYAFLAKQVSDKILEALNAK